MRFPAASRHSALSPTLPRRLLGRGGLLPSAVFLAAWALVGCDCGSEEDNPPVVYVAKDAVHQGVYESSPVLGKWLYFPGGRRYRLYHGLGVVPKIYQADLAFSEYSSSPEATPDGGISSASAAGNSVSWEEINDRYIQVGNHTCAWFYLRVVATTLGTGSDGDAGSSALISEPDVNSTQR